MAPLARPSSAWLGLLALAVLGCFDDPPEVGDETTASTGGTGPTTGDTTSPDPTTTSPTTTTDPGTTTVDPDTTKTTTVDPDSGSSTSDTGPMECSAADGQPDGACPAMAPFCVGGSCVPCGGGGDCAALDPLAPICGDDDVCRPCVEHPQCPSGAGCHLFEGSCLPADRVYYVDSSGMCGPGGATQAMPACDIPQAFGAAAGQPMATIHLAQDVYLDPVTVTAGRVIALRGQGAVTVVTNASTTVTVLGTAYLEGIDVQNFDPLGTGLESSGDVWLDDSMVRNNETGLSSSGGRVVLRRTRVLDSGGVGVMLGSSEGSTLINTIVAGNGDGFDPPPSGIASTGTGPIEVLYSTIVQNGGANGGGIACGPGVATVRNSIVSSLALSNAIVCAAGTTVTHSVVSDAQFDADPTNVPLMSYVALGLDADYEVGPVSVAAGVAQWEQGDPPTDINGAPRPAVPGSADHAGADLPN